MQANVANKSPYLTFVAPAALGDKIPLLPS